MHAIALLEESNTSPPLAGQPPRAVSPIPEDSPKAVEAEVSAGHGEDPVEELKRTLEDLGPHTPADLEQNRSLRLVATGTRAGSVPVLVKHISKVGGVQKGSQMQRRWKLGTDKKAVHLKVLEMRGSAFNSAASKAYNLSWASSRILRDGRSTSNAVHMHEYQHVRQMSRAIYMVVFRVFVDKKTLADQERREAISIIRTINRMGPNVRVVVVPTVLSASEARHEQVQMQCCTLREQLQQDKLAHMLFLDSDGAAVSLDGPDMDKVGRLTDALHATATSSVAYCELLPSFIFSLRERIAVAKDTGSKFLSWEEYKHSCALSGVPPGEDMLELTTDLLQDLGDIKYFGSNIVYIDLAWVTDAVNSLTVRLCTLVCVISGENIGEKNADASRARRCAQDKFQRGAVRRKQDETAALHTHYAGSRPDHSARAIPLCVVLMSSLWFCSKQDIDCTKLVSFLADRSPSLAYLASKLVQNGIMHPRLLPFVWPSLHRSEGWPGVDSELIVSFWAQEIQDDKGDGSKVHAVATDRLSLEAAHAACLGLGYCFSEQSKGITASDRQKLRDFVRICEHYDKEDQVVTKMRSWSKVPCVMIPELVNRTTWHDAACIVLPDNDAMTQEICMVHLPEAQGMEFRETLALYECIRVSRGSLEPKAVKLKAPMSSTTATASPRSPAARGHSRANVYNFQRQLPLPREQTIKGRVVRIDLSRRMRISLRRLKTDPTNHVGFDALLGIPSWQESTQAQAESFQDALENLPPALYSDGSIQVEHTMVIYRVSILSSFKGLLPRTYLCEKTAW